MPCPYKLMLPSVIRHLYYVLCTLYSVLCTLYSVICHLLSVICYLYSVHFLPLRQGEKVSGHIAHGT